MSKPLAPEMVEADEDVQLCRFPREWEDLHTHISTEVWRTLQRMEMPERRLFINRLHAIVEMRLAGAQAYTEHPAPTGDELARLERARGLVRAGYYNEGLSGGVDTAP